MGSAVRVSLRIDLWSEGRVVGRVQSFLDVRVAIASSTILGCTTQVCERSTMTCLTEARHPPPSSSFLALVYSDKDSKVERGGTDLLLQKIIERAK